MLIYLNLVHVMEVAQVFGIRPTQEFLVPAEILRLC